MFLLLFILAWLTVITHTNLYAQPTIMTLNTTTKTQLQKMVLLDARDLKICQSSSVSGAYCLPASDFYAKNGELASFYDIGWAFGTAGLKESDNTLVFSDRAQDGYLLAGLLFLSGQQKVTYWTGTIRQLQALFGESAGKPRGILRSHVYSGVMQDSYLVLDNDSATEKYHKHQKIVTEKTPVASVTTFARLLSKGKQQIALNINPNKY
jgi:hypothetical protein